MMNNSLISSWLLVVGLGFGCAHQSVEQSIKPLVAGKVVHGKASYYADFFHGRKTASGEIYRHEGLTAAHNRLKFGTRVKVTNKRNGKSVVVKINDRGGFTKVDIDLSNGAARRIGMLKEGIAKVTLEFLSQH